jgi:hypothetical protein
MLTAFSATRLNAHASQRGDCRHMNLGLSRLVAREGRRCKGILGSYVWEAGLRCTLICGTGKGDDFCITFGTSISLDAYTLSYTYMSL